MNRKATIIAGLAVLLVIVGAAGIALSRSKTQVSADADSDKQSEPMFSFTGAEGWREGPSDEISMALFGPSKEDGTSACFTSVEYKTGTVAIDVELSKQTKNITKPTTLKNTLKSTVAAVSGPIQYDLYQYEITDESSEPLMKGLELGYVQIDGGYVEIEGHCNEFEELTTTLSALEAYRLN